MPQENYVAAGASTTAANGTSIDFRTSAKGTAASTPPIVVSISPNGGLELLTTAGVYPADPGLGCASIGGTIKAYNGVATAAAGIPAIVAYGRLTGQTAAVNSLTTFTVGASDGSFLVIANFNLSASSGATFTTTVSYTDENGSATTLTLWFSNSTGASNQNIGTATGAYSSIPTPIRAQAGSTITIKTTGTFTGATYNAEAFITQLA
jgi:hypothetical protein